MATEILEKNERKYYVDWLRIFLILSVFLYHIGMIFISWDWHVKNDEVFGYRSTLWYTMVFLGRWRMPLLILISGAGTYLALGKRTSGQYLKERFKRLFIPLFAGIFILVPVQVYIEKSANYGSLLDYYPHMFEGIYPAGNFSWHHLWFICYLFFIALVISPFLNLLRSSRFDLFIGRMVKVTSKKLGANIFLIPLILSQIILRPFFPDNTHALINDWAFVALYLIFFLSGYIIIASNKIVSFIMEQRNLFLIESAVATTVMFTFPSMFDSQLLKDLFWDIPEIVVAWSTGLAVFGYAKKYLNFDNRLRKVINAAIYPFYLLHQPIIVIVGYFVVPMEISIWAKVAFILIVSFSLTVAVYWFVVKRFNFTRIIFGMKPKAVTRHNRSETGNVKPALVHVKSKYLL